MWSLDRMRVEYAVGAHREVVRVERSTGDVQRGRLMRNQLPDNGTGGEARQSGHGPTSPSSVVPSMPSAWSLSSEVPSTALR